MATTVTLESYKKLVAELKYLKDTASKSELLTTVWLEGLSNKSELVFSEIKETASSDYCCVSLAVDIINNNPIKY